MDASEGLPSLLGITVRRSLIVGRISLLLGCGMVMFYSAVFGLEGALFVSLGTVILPIFAVSGGLGGAIVYSNDRLKGVLEYLVAYGISPRRLLWNAIVAGLVQVSILLSLGVTAGVTTYLLSGHPLTPLLPERLLAYTFPLSYLTVGLMTTVGVYWTTLSSPRAGMNSPVGVLPMIGILPPVAVLGLALAFPAHATQLVVGVELAIFALLAFLLTRTERLLPTERLLSPG